MNVHEHDRDLIMALAEGSLDAVATREATEALSGCDECAAEIELQRVALDAFRSAPPAAMTEMEAARLKRDLDTALGHERTVAPAPRQRRRFNWAPVFSVAAILVALVLVAPALNLLGGGDDNAGADVVAIEEFASEQSADADDGADAAGGTVAAESAPAATEAPSLGAAGLDRLATAEDETTADSSGRLSSAAEYVDPISARLISIQLALTQDASLDAEGLAFSLQVTEATSRDQDCVADGAAAVNADVRNSLALGSIDVDGVTYAVTAHADSGTTYVAAHDRVTCAIVGLIP